LGACFDRSAHPSFSRHWLSLLIARWQGWRAQNLWPSSRALWPISQYLPQNFYLIFGCVKWLSLITLASVECTIYGTGWLKGPINGEFGAVPWTCGVHCSTPRCKDPDRPVVSLGLSALVVPYPDNRYLISELRSMDFNYLYISHAHEDHYDERLLRTLNRSITVIAPK
jgi:hypothetical protein